MFCTQCGFKLEDDDYFCAKCGKAARPDAPPRAASSRRRLVRPMADKKIAGVCAGFARYIDVDVVLMRVLWLVMAIVTGGLGFIFYLVAWAVMPREEEFGPNAAYQSPPERQQG